MKKLTFPLIIASALLAAAPSLALAQSAQQADVRTQGTPSELVLDNTQRVLSTIEERRAEGLPVYMEYMFSVPEPEMPTHRNSFAARLKRFVSRVKGGGLRSPFDRQVEGMAGIIAPKLEIPPRERDEARLKEVVERYNRVCKPLFEAEESLAKGGKP